MASYPTDWLQRARSEGFVIHARHLPYHPALVAKARALRINMTEAESRIWKLVLRPLPYRIFRQRPIDHYIVDFYIPRLRLIIEIDGSHHESPEEMEYDAVRTEILQSYDLRIIRFSNTEVLHRLAYVRKKLEPILDSGE